MMETGDTLRIPYSINNTNNMDKLVVSANRVPLFHYWLNVIHISKLRCGCE